VKCGQIKDRCFWSPDLRQLIESFIPVQTGHRAVQKKSTAPAMGLSGAVCELVRALAFGTLAAGIGTIIPATVRGHLSRPSYMPPHFQSDELLIVMQ
jgi:hypothetical protein